MDAVNPFKTSGPETIYEVAYWDCGCRTWPIVVSTSTWDEEQEKWKKESWWVRECGYCDQYPHPPMEERISD